MPFSGFFSRAGLFRCVGNCSSFNCSFVSFELCVKGAFVLFIWVNTDGGITEEQKLWGFHNAIHFQHLRCVLCTHRHRIVPPGSRRSFCLAWIPLLSLSFALFTLLHSYPLPPPRSQNLILKKDYRKTTWAISCRPENYPPVEKTRSPRPTLPSLPPCSLPAQIWRGDNSSSGGGGGSLVERYKSVSFCLPLSAHP